MRLDVQRAQRPHRVTGEPGGLHQLLGRGRPTEPLGQQRRRPAQPVEVRRPVQRHPHRPAVPGDGRLNRLADPPDRVGDELDAAVGVELPGRRHEADVALADQIHERDAAVLELLGHRDDEPHVVAREPLLRLHVALERTPGQRRLLLDLEQGDPADLLEVEIQALAPLVDRPGKLRRPAERRRPPFRLVTATVLLLFHLSAALRQRPTSRCHETI